MTQEFKDQGGAASSTPSRFKRWMGSRVVPRLLSQKRLHKKRALVEAERLKAAAPHQLEYFHQVDDAYSHLAAQMLVPLLQRYDIQLTCHLVAGPAGKNLPEPDLLPSYGRMDCEQVARHYGLHFPSPCQTPDPDEVALATRILAGVSAGQFGPAAIAVGEALWSGDREKLQALASEYREQSEDAAQARVAAGTARQLELKHYSGGMFYYGGEWYWGVDRLYHLEQRLVDLGLGEDSLLLPRPEIVNGPLKDNGSLTLEIYPSLRSPYTAIIFDRAVAMAHAMGVKLVVRPVMPMVMRGVTLTREKSLYIMTDTAREATALGVEGFGGMYDPIGEPVRRGFSLYPWAVSKGKGSELVSAFLRAAFFQRINTLSDRGMRWVVERAGLPWKEAREVMGNSDWQEELEQNRMAMYEWGSWGVPSFRVIDGNGEPLLNFWGQDRLWVVAKEIQRILSERAPS